MDPDGFVDSCLVGDCCKFDKGFKLRPLPDHKPGRVSVKICFYTIIRFYTFIPTSEEFPKLLRSVWVMLDLNSKVECKTFFRSAFISALGFSPENIFTEIFFHLKTIWPLRFFKYHSKDDYHSKCSTFGHWLEDSPPWLVKTISSACELCFSANFSLRLCLFNRGGE